MTQRVAVIGIGSPQGEDRLGWDLVAALERAPAAFAAPGVSVRFTLCRHPARDLLPRLAACDLAVLVDAVRADEPPGTVLRLDPRELSGGGAGLSSHGLGLAAVLALGRAVDRRAPRVVVLGVVAPPEGSPDVPVAQVLPQIIRRIGEEIGRARVPPPLAPGAA